MIGLLSTALVLVTVFLYYVLMVWPATFIAWIHLPGWLLLGLLGGFLAWCIADD